MSGGDASDQSRRFSVLSWDQVQRLDSILGETVPIHGRGNFPTLSVQPRLIVQVNNNNNNIKITTSFIAQMTGEESAVLNISNL